jgi:hypothetical protein
MPDTSKVPFNDPAAIEKALHGKDTAAFVVEPVQGKTCAVADDGYLTEASRPCRNGRCPFFRSLINLSLCATALNLAKLPAVPFSQALHLFRSQPSD